MGWFIYGRFFKKLIAEKCFYIPKTYFNICCTPYKHFPLARASRGSDSGYSTPLNSRETVFSGAWGSGSEDTKSKRHTGNRRQGQSQAPHRLLHTQHSRSHTPPWSPESWSSSSWRNSPGKQTNREKGTPKWLWAEVVFWSRGMKWKVPILQIKGQSVPTSYLTSFKSQDLADDVAPFETAAATLDTVPVASGNLYHFNPI